RVLRVQSQSRGESASNRELQRIVVIAPAALLDVYLGIRPEDCVPLHNVELANDNRAQVWIRIGSRLDDPIRDIAQEKVASLASYISRGESRSIRQLLLQRDAVLIHPFRNPVARRVSARLELAVVRIV